MNPGHQAILDSLREARKKLEEETGRFNAVFTPGRFEEDDLGEPIPDETVRELRAAAKKLAEVAGSEDGTS